jgi:phage baseplate assembly protein W
MAAELGSGAAFLGRGWSFPVTADSDGRIRGSDHEESVRQAIWIILGTSPGERPMRPDFGCGMHELVFSLNDANTAGLLVDEVRQALIRWEPRIELIDVSVGSPPGQELALTIRVEYRVRSTNNVFNLVYPFYLAQEPA